MANAKFKTEWLGQIALLAQCGTADDVVSLCDALTKAMDGEYEAELSPLVQLVFNPIAESIEADRALSKVRSNARNGNKTSTKSDKASTKPNKTATKADKSCEEERERETESEKESSKEKDKDKEIEREEYTDASFDNTKVLSHSLSCSEPEKPASEPPEPPVITLTLNDGSEWPVTTEMVTEWSSLYPAVDVMQQLRNMRGWLLSNPNKRKTGRGIKAFINTWLTKEQDRPRARSGTIDNRPRKLTAEELFNLPAISLRKESD